MATAKSSTVKLYSNVPFDSSYNNVLHYTTSYALNNFLDTKCTIVYNGSALSYIRPESGTCRCNGSVTANLYRANYMYFTNTGVAKSFYAFVKQIKYINDNTFEIDFELDLFHSYIFYAQLNPCFIERQHSTTDKIGDNLQPEPQFNNLDYTATAKYIDLGLRYCLVTTTDNDGASAISYNKSSGEIIGGYRTIYDDINSFINAVFALVSGGKADTIVTACYYPAVTDTSVTINRPTTINGYTPKNNKCLSGLFVKLIATNNLGQKQVYTFERGVNGSIKFDTKSTFSAPPTVMLYPNAYDSQIDNVMSGLVYDNYPLIPVIKDNYAEYFNNNYNSLMTNILSQSLQGVGNLLTLNLGGAFGNAGSLQSEMSSLVDMTKSSTRFSVGQSSANGLLNLANNASGTNNMRGFTLFLNIPRATEIKLIDNYFTRYGYAQNSVATPNISARPCYTYIKTRDSNVTGTIPDNARVLINSVFNKGTTFWQPSAKVGNYTQDNSIKE